MNDIHTAKEKLPLPNLIQALGGELRPEPKNPHKFTIFSPLRDDGKNPSFEVARKGDDYVFYDHGIKEGGDEVTYIQLRCNLSLKEAIKEFLTLADVKRSPNGSKPRSEIVKTYDYFDEFGNLLHQTVRFQPKKFLL